jgi:hypothetical protein
MISIIQRVPEYKMDTNEGAGLGVLHPA